MAKYCSLLSLVSLVYPAFAGPARRGLLVSLVSLVSLFPLSTPAQRAPVTSIFKYLLFINLNILRFYDIFFQYID